MNVVLLEEHDRIGDATFAVNDARAVHIYTVLKARAGQQVRVGMIDGPLGTGTIESIEPRAVTLRCIFETALPPRPRVDLLLALPRPKVMRRLWAQLAALGIGQIILTNAERVERPYFDTHVLDEATYRPLLIEGLQQARDTRLPAVSIHRQFKILIEDHLDRLSPGSRRLVADPSGATSMTAVVGGAVEERVLLAVGPEGGWNTFELSLLRAHGFHLAGMGPRTLRVDTACVALLAIVHATLRNGD
jgi:RsmE family RNA methyltransferase